MIARSASTSQPHQPDSESSGLLHLPTMNPDYVTVYQIGSDPAYASFALTEFYIHISVFVLGIALIAVASIFLARTVFLRRRNLWAIVIPLCIGAAIVWLAGTPRRMRGDEKALSRFERGDYKTLSGAVTDFDPMPYEGHKRECFTVQTARFCYSDYMIDPGFRNTTSHGGPIHPGLNVRISYVPAFRRNMILRIEVKNDQGAGH